MRCRRWRAGPGIFSKSRSMAPALGFIVKRAFHVARLEAENRRLKSGPSQALPGLITANPGMLEACRTVERIAPTSVNVLLLGESGTGKELLARAVHEKSPRRDQPFVAINCAAIPDALLESELFGYEKGAFTGATRQVKGKIETANRGTLFLDEIGDMPFNLQAKLLRFVEERRIERLGGRQPDRGGRAHRVGDPSAPDGARRRGGSVQAGSALSAGRPDHRDPGRCSARGDDTLLLLAQHFIETFAAEHGRPGQARLAENAKRLLHGPWLARQYPRAREHRCSGPSSSRKGARSSSQVISSLDAQTCNAAKAWSRHRLSCNRIRQSSSRFRDARDHAERHRRRCRRQKVRRAIFRPLPSFSGSAAPPSIRCSAVTRSRHPSASADA